MRLTLKSSCLYFMFKVDRSIGCKLHWQRWRRLRRRQQQRRRRRRRWHCGVHGALADSGHKTKQLSDCESKESDVSRVCIIFYCIEYVHVLRYFFGEDKGWFHLHSRQNEIKIWLIDMKDMEVAKLIWLPRCPKKVISVLKSLKNAFLPLKLPFQDSLTTIICLFLSTGLGRYFGKPVN